MYILNLMSCGFFVEKMATHYNKLNNFRAVFHKNEEKSTLHRQIRPQHEQTLKVIIKLYAKKLNSYFDSGSRNLKEINGPEAISIAHSYKWIAANRRVSARTVERHINHLEEAGLIIKRHTYAAVRIFINPEVLVFNEEKKFKNLTARLSTMFAQTEVEIQKKEGAENQQSKKTKATSCRTMYRTGNNIKRLITNVEKGITGFKREENAETKRNFLEQREINRKILSKKDRAQKLEQKRREARRKTIEKHAAVIWKFAYQKLYEPQLGHNISFISVSQEQYAVKFFKEELDKVPDRDLNKAANAHYRRIRQWYNWINKDKVKGYTPLPNKFFNPHWHKGYAVTLQWQAKAVKHQKFLKIQNKIGGWIRRIQQAYQFSKPFSEILELRMDFDKRKESLISKELNNLTINRNQATALRNLYEERVNEVIKLAE